MLIGAHVSTAGGMDLTIQRGEAMGADCIQTFASPPRTLKFTPLSDEVIQKYLTNKRASSIRCHVFHGIYLVNLASEKKEYVSLSIHSLVQYQRTAAAIGALGTIFHVGSHKGSGFEAVKQQVADALVEVLKESPKEVTLILENTAGLQGPIGQSIDELATLFDVVDKSGSGVDQLGLCLDTQHAFASGVDGRNQARLTAYLDEVDKKIGLQHLKAIHINDSKVPLAAHKDRHENIGAGELGDVGIRNWLLAPPLSAIPFILEVPGVKGSGPGQADINSLRQLCQDNH